MTSLAQRLQQEIRERTVSVCMYAWMCVCVTAWYCLSWNGFVFRLEHLLLNVWIPGLCVHVQFYGYKDAAKLIVTLGLWYCILHASSAHYPSVKPRKINYSKGRHINIPVSMLCWHVRWHVFVRQHIAYDGFFKRYWFVMETSLRMNVLLMNCCQPIMEQCMKNEEDGSSPGPALVSNA